MTIIQLTRAPPPLHLASATSLLLTSSLPPELTVNILIILFLFLFLLLICLLILIISKIEIIITHIGRLASTLVLVGQ